MLLTEYNHFKCLHIMYLSTNYICFSITNSCINRVFLCLICYVSVQSVHLGSGTSTLRLKMFVEINVISVNIHCK